MAKLKMFCTAVITAAVTGLGAATGQAQDFNGWCFDGGECTGTVRISEDSFDLCEESCRLTNPVSVNGLTATLFDVECMSDHAGRTSERMLFLRYIDQITGAERGLMGGSTELFRCNVPQPTHATGGAIDIQTTWSTEADICTVEQAMEFGDRAPMLITIEGEMTLEGVKSFSLWSYETGCEWEFLYVARTGRHAVGDGACWAEGEQLDIAPVGFEFRDGGRVYLYGDQQDDVFGRPTRLYPCPN